MDKKEAKLAYKNATKIGAVFAYTNLESGKKLLDISQDASSVENRFNFFKHSITGLPMKIQEDAKSQEFSVEILETLKKTDLQTDREFKQDLETLKEIWQEKFAAEELY